MVVLQYVVHTYYVYSIIWVYTVCGGIPQSIVASVLALS